MENEGLLFVAICMACAVLFLIMGLLARKKPEPVQFWSGWEVTEKNIRDIPAYNRAYGRIWIVYALAWFLAGLTPFITSAPISVILIGIVCFGGIPSIILTYRKIYKKYKR